MPAFNPSDQTSNTGSSPDVYNLVEDVPAGKMAMPRLVICSSVTFYPELPSIKKQFQAIGLDVTIPKMAREFERELPEEEKAALLKTESVTPQVKRIFIEEYFSEIEHGDLIMAYNQSKHGIPGYIGPNVLMELTVAFYLKKKLFVWNAVGEEVHGAEELRAMGVQPLDGVPQTISNII